MRKGTQLFLASAMAVIGANTAAVATATTTTGGAFLRVTPSRGGRGKAGARGPVDPVLCGREATDCTDDAECGGCLAMVTAWDWGGGAELPELGVRSHGGGGGGGGGAGTSWDLFFEARPPATRCEKVGATACSGFTAAAQQEEEEELAGKSDSSGWRRTDSCLGNRMGNRMVQELLACRVRTAGCEPNDAPCIMPEKQRPGGVSSTAGESRESNIARPASRPLSDELGRGGRVHAMPAAATATTAAIAAVNARADADGFGPEWVTRHQRRLATSSEATCDGIQGVSACCSADCGECGGSGCSARGGGGDYCCRANILDSGIMCSDTGGAPPCIVDDSPDAGDAETSSPATAQTPSPVAPAPAPSSPATSAAPSAAEAAATSSEATCDGIQGVNACCSADCGECGGSGCSARGGGGDYCCRANIMDSGIMCSDTGGAPPCIVDDSPDAGDAETPSPATSETPSPVTHEPPSPISTSSPVVETPSPSESPIASPTESPFPTAAATTPDSLGSGYMSGLFSADGVSDDLLAALGGDGVVKQVVCELDTCPGGLESVLVGDEAAAQLSGRMLLLLREHPQSQSASRRRGEGPHQAVRDGDATLLRGQDRARRPGDGEGASGRMLWRPLGSRGRRRRLADIEDIAFSVPLDGGTEGEDGEVMTGSQQAAAFVNSMADPVALAGIAADLGVDLEALHFADVAFHQGSEFSIEKEFRVIGDENTGRIGTWILALLLVAFAVLPVACFWRYHLDPGKERSLRASLDKPVPKRVSTSSAAWVVPNGSKRNSKQVVMPQTESMCSYDMGRPQQPHYGGGEDCKWDNSDVSQNQHRNSMPQRKKAGSGLGPRDLAQHYQSSGGSSSDGSFWVDPKKQVSNPMFDRASSQAQPHNSEDENRQPYSDTEPSREMGQTKPEARVATAAPRSYNRSYSELEVDLSPVDERVPSECDVSISSYAASGQTGMRRDHLNLLRRRNSSMNESVTSSNLPAGGGGNGNRNGSQARGSGVPDTVMEYSDSSGDSDGTGNGDSDGASRWASATGTNHHYGGESTTVGASATTRGRKGSGPRKPSLDASFSDEEEEEPTRGRRRGSPTRSSGSFLSLASRVTNDLLEQGDSDSSGSPTFDRPPWRSGEFLSACMEESPGINHRPEARGSSAGGHRSGMDGACMEESPGTHHRPEARSHRSGLGGASFGSISTESDVMSSTALEGGFDQEDMFFFRKRRETKDRQARF